MNMIRAYVLAGVVASPNRVPVITKNSVNASYRSPMPQESTGARRESGTLHRPRPSHLTELHAPTRIVLSVPQHHSRTDRRSPQKVNTFLDNGGDSWRFGLALDHRVLGDFKGLVVCIEQPLEGLCFGRRGEGDSFLLTRLGVAPADRERSRSVRFFSLPNAGLRKNSRLRVHTKRGFVCTLRGPKGPLTCDNTVPEVGLEPHSGPRKHWEV